MVPKKDGGHRTHYQLERVQRVIPHTHFKMEGIHMLKDLLQQGDFMAKLDLKDAYFVVPISEEDRKHLRFRWGNRMFQFNCLPFGLPCAPWVFTKIMKAIVTILKYQTHHLPRQHPGHSGVGDSTEGPHSRDHIELGICPGLIQFIGQN